MNQLFSREDLGLRQNLEQDLRCVPCHKSDFPDLPSAGRAFQVPQFYFLQNGSNDEKVYAVLLNARIKSQSKLNHQIEIVTDIVIRKAEKQFSMHRQEDGLMEGEEQHPKQELCL